MIRLVLHQLSRTSGSGIRAVILPHAGGSASYFRDWGSCAQRLGVELHAVQYPGHEELFSSPQAGSLDELAEAVTAQIADQAERTVLFGHSMGGLLAHRTAQFLQRQGRSLRALHISATRAPDQPVMRPRHLLQDPDLVASIGEMSPGEQNFLADPQIAAVLLPQVRHEMMLAETHRCEPAPLDQTIELHLGDDDPDFTIADAPAWRRFSTGGTRLSVHAGHHFYLAKAKSEILAHFAGPPPETCKPRSERHPLCNT